MRISGMLALVAVGLAVLGVASQAADDESWAWCQAQLDQHRVRVAVAAADGSLPPAGQSVALQSRGGGVRLIRRSLRLLLVPSSGERTVPGNTAIDVRSQRYQSWALAPGDEAGVVLSQASPACVAAVRAACDHGSVDLRDPASAHGEALGPLLSALGWPSGGAGAATFSARLWPRGAVGHPCCELLCDDELAGTTLTIGARQCRLDECLAAVALALGAEWRRVGSILFLATQNRLATAGVGAQYLYGEDAVPSAPGGIVLGVPLGLVASNSAWSGLLSRHCPIIELWLRTESGSTERRAMLVAWEPSRAALHALRSPEPPLHCAAESVLGFAEGRETQVGKASRDALVAATEDKGDLDGNELIALAKSVGVELVGVKGTLDEIGEKQGVAIVHLDWGHYVAVTDCDSAFVTLLGADGRRARFPKDALESGMSGTMFVSPDLLEGEDAEGGQ